MPTSPVRRQRERRPQAERRAEFLDATVSLIRREGAMVSMEAIAREAGVTKPILYRLFGDRDGLLQALGERLAKDVMDQILATIARAEEDAATAPRAALRTAIEAYIELIDRDPEVYRFLTERSTAGAPGRGLASEVARGVTLVLGERIRAEKGDSGAAEPWAFGLVGMIHLASDWWVQNRTMPRERLVDYLVDLLWDGFGGMTDRVRGGPR